MNKTITLFGTCALFLALSYFSFINLVYASENIQTQGNSCNKEICGYNSLTDKQVEDFLKSRNITPLSIKTVGNSTIILYETNESIGSYVLSSGQNESINMANGSTRKNSVIPVLIGIHKSEGLEGAVAFAQIIINDANILKNASFVKVTFSDKTEATEFANNKGYAIIFPTYSLSISNVSIYDKSGNTLYNKTISN